MLSSVAHFNSPVKKSAMSDCDSPDQSHRRISEKGHFCEGCEVRSDALLISVVCSYVIGKCCNVDLVLSISKEGGGSKGRVVQAAIGRPHRKKSRDLSAHKGVCVCVCVDLYDVGTRRSYGDKAST